MCFLFSKELAIFVNVLIYENMLQTCFTGEGRGAHLFHFWAWACLILSVNKQCNVIINKRPYIDSKIKDLMKPSIALSRSRISIVISGARNELEALLYLRKALLHEPASAARRARVGSTRSTRACAIRKEGAFAVKRLSLRLRLGRIVACLLGARLGAVQGNIRYIRIFRRKSVGW